MKLLRYILPATVAKGANDHDEDIYELYGPDDFEVKDEYTNYLVPLVMTIPNDKPNLTVVGKNKKKLHFSTKKYYLS